MVNGIAKIMNVEPERVRMELSGLNHHVLLQMYFIDGKSVLDEVIEKYAHVDPSDALAMKNFNALPFSPAFIRGLHSAYHALIIIIISLPRAACERA